MSRSETAKLVSPNTLAIMEWDGVERREVKNDRRHYSLSTFKHQITAPRRTQGRRKEDRRFPVLDRFETGLFTLAMSLLCLSIMDAMFTLTLISHGGSEVNPFMNAMLGVSVWAFVAVKMLLTAIPAVVLVATSNLVVFGVIRVRMILAAAVGMYAGLIVYELALLSLI